MEAENPIVECEGTVEAAVNALMAFSRVLWQVAFSDHRRAGSTKDRNEEWVYLDESHTRVQLEELSINCLSVILEQLHKEGRHALSDDGKVVFHFDVFHPLRLIRLLLADAQADHELRYFVMKNIRYHYKAAPTSETVRRVGALADAANELRTERLRSANSQDKSWMYHEFFASLQEGLSNAIDTELDIKGDRGKCSIALFIEVSRALGYIQIRRQPGSIRFHATVDSEYMLNNLFGMPTDIEGFDDLFGGAGLMLSERPYSRNEGQARTNQLPGRTILVKGRSGTGKTVLALKLAVEVARKGGAAWVMPLEQSAEESLYVLEAMGALPKDGSVRVVSNPITARMALLERAESNRNGGQVAGRGLLIILRTVKEPYSDFLTAFQENAEYLREYPFRLMVVDPINSLVRPDSPVARLRIQTLDAINAVTEMGTNVLLVGEESIDAKGNETREELLFEENIADTVIRLMVDPETDYARRMFEVLKSRYQREVRGRHPFAIVVRKGISISPSSPAVMSRIRARSPKEPKDPITFGLKELDTILGTSSMTVMAGDVLVMRGPAGSFKTELGLYFLFGSDHHRGTATSSSLFVAARDNEYTIQDTLRRNTPSSSNLAKPIRICALPKGYVDPGYILRTIEKEFDRAQLENEPIDRVLVDDVSYWDMSCPLVRADPAFGDTLVELVRRRGATGLFICGEVSEEMESTVQRPVVNNADCEIVLTRFMYHGIDRVNLRVLKTRGMRHLRESYEVTFDPRSSEVVVRRNSSLLRLSATGEVEQIKVRLFLHAENQAQIDYNSQIQHYLQSVLSRDAEIETETWIDIGDVGRLSASSAVNELQVLHVDEFQLTSASRIPQETRALYEFPNVLWGEEREWKDFVPRLTENIDRGGGNFVAVPFYENISLLAFRENKVDRGILKDWEKLAKACAEWEAEDADSLFFEFPRGTAENYNCLFIEILLSLAQPTIWQNFRCQLVKWLCSDKAIAAAVIYRRLCRRAYTKAKLKDRNRGGFRQAAPPVDVSVNPDAVVWRHWYNTLAQMMENPELQDPFGIKVVALPGGFTIAGEWYLALPAYSAAPDVGLEIIKQMTTREAEMERLQLGIGLPTRQTYYLSGGDHALPESPLSSNMEMSMDELHTLISTAFQRSAFGCYPKASRIIARALQRIIEIPDMEEDAIIEGIARILQNLEASINFLLRDESCADCYIHSRKPTIPRVTAP